MVTKYGTGKAYQTLTNDNNDSEISFTMNGDGIMNIRHNIAMEQRNSITELIKLFWISLYNNNVISYKTII